MMADQSVAPAGDAARSRSELVAALPTVRRLIEQLHKAIQPAVVAEYAAPEAQAMFQAATAIRWLADALDAPSRASRIARLTEVTNRADYITRSAQQRLAELQTIDELAADEQDRRIGSVGTTAIVDRTQCAVVLPNGTSTTITVTTTDGQVAWEASTVDLGPVDGPVQLDVTTMLSQLGETLTKALPASAFDEQW